MEDVIARMQDEKNGIPIRTVKSFLSKIPSVFSGKSAFSVTLFPPALFTKLFKICSSHLLIEALSNSLGQHYVGYLTVKQVKTSKKNHNLTKI